ncbi:hypothetical protein [Cyclobacterium qasimii]|uniref:Uncharacterized protein n=1 Tax=Cyclobacterium qasimii TaxID=1350429 RepID=A0A512C7D2_9BACT|nr:hypothetical protein [Cyclobacterium qasimii]GEO20111.1 hypothetical protein CQA01_06450 [Cyclobacterium qasimii]
MTKYMKNVWMYHLVADLPMIAFIYTWIEHYNTIVFVVFGCIIYPFVYRPIIDYYRLLALGEIEKKDFSKMWKWGGLYRLTHYYGKLMFGI